MPEALSLPETAGAIGELAADFTLKTQTGADWTLKRQRGKVVLLLFYPGNETLMCTRQLCSVRDSWTQYVKTGAEIVGISSATIEEQLAFATHHNLPLTLLADANKTITKKYLREWAWLHWAMRALVVVDARGVVRHRRVMPRAFRPADRWSLVAIRQAQFDEVVC